MSAATESPVQVDYEPYSHRWQQDPYPIYRMLRDQAPVHHALESDAWTVSRYEDVQHVLRNPELFSSRTMNENPRMQGASTFERLRVGIRFMRALRTGPLTMARSRMLIMEDGETHSAMRDFVNRGFTPRAMSQLENRIREIAEHCLDGIDARNEFDLVSELNVPLPVTVIAELLGIDPEHHSDFKRWSDDLIAGSTGSTIDPMSGDMPRVLGEMRDYFRPIVAARRARPADDLISVLVGTDGEGALSDFEVFFFVLLLLVAGNETTTNLLGNAVDALLDHPDQLAKVAADPSLVPAVVEETLRFDGPVQRISRIATRDVEIHGTQIPKGAVVLCAIGSANRDERRFPEPDRFDISRDTRGHVAFGYGEHFCLGASLARLEARVALEQLAPHLPRFERADSERTLLDSYVIRGPSILNLRAIQ